MLGDNRDGCARNSRALRSRISISVSLYRACPEDPSCGAETDSPEHAANVGPGSPGWYSYSQLVTCSAGVVRALGYRPPQASANGI